MSIHYPDNTVARTSLPASGITDSLLSFDISYSGVEKRFTLEELKKTGVQVVNVKQYGAVGDGVTDDTVAVQAVLTSLINGGVAYFPQGEYLCSSTIIMPSYVTIMGGHVDESSIKSTASIAVKVGRYCRIKNIRIWGGDTAASVGVGQVDDAGGGDYYFAITDCHIADFATGIKFTNAWSSSIERTRITSCVDYGIRLTSANCNALTFTQCAINSNGVGVYIDTFTSNCSFKSCSIEQSMTYGIRLNGSPVRSMSIEDCYFEGNSSGHIFNEGISYALRIEANSFYGTPPPVVMTPSNGSMFQTGTVLASNYFEDLTTARSYDITLSSLTVRDTLLISEGGIWTSSTAGVGVLARVSDGGLRTQRLYGIKPWDLGSVGASRTINWSTCVNNKILMDQNTTLSFTTPASPGILTLIIEQNGTGGYTVTWPSINWKMGSKQPDSGAWNKSIFHFYYDGATYSELSTNTLPILPVEANTAISGSPNILDDSESQTILTNEGTASINYHILPTAVAGLSYPFMVQSASGMRITANTGDTIRLGDKVTATAGYIESTGVGDWAILNSINNTEWMGQAYGTWTNGTWTYTVKSTT